MAMTGGGINGQAPLGGGITGAPSAPGNGMGAAFAGVNGGDNVQSILNGTYGKWVVCDICSSSLNLVSMLFRNETGYNSTYLSHEYLVVSTTVYPRMLSEGIANHTRHTGNDKQPCKKA